VISTASTIAPGSIVVVRDAEWLVTATEMTADGLLIRVQGLSELVRDTTAAFYESLDDIQPMDPAAARVVLDTSPGFRKAKLWLEATLRKTAVPLGETSLTVATQMLTDPLDYQKSAVRQALARDQLRPRILIADAVGLGKTIEIGMILSELTRRGRGDRILIVTPKHVLEQMQHEMWTRFGLPFVRLDSVGIQRVRQRMPATRNPFSLFKRVIISIDTLKQDGYLSHLSNHRWDAVVIDESHNITGATQNNKLARVLAPNTEALILASATPHNGRAESFAELMRLLEPTAVSPDGVIIEDEVRRLIIRRHRHSPEVAREVGADWAERLPPQNFLVPASPEENAIADELATVWLHPAAGSSPYSGSTKGLFPWTLAKAFLSSPAAFSETVSERIRRLGDTLTVEQRHEREALDRLAALAVASLDAPSAKYTRLLEYLKTIGVGAKSTERAVVFSERVPTLRWLREKLLKDLGMAGDQIRILDGSVSEVDQQEIVESFKQSGSPIRILVTGDIASEGVNLHSQCHELIHFDIPWSLIRIEQRNGRIDRYGQKNRPQITTLLLSPSSADFSGDVRVLQRLLEREQEAHTALGDVASLMGKYDVAAEEDLILQALSGTKDIDVVVPTVDEAMAGADSIGAMLARLAQGEALAAEVPDVPDSDPGSGLFASPVDYLREALTEIYGTPGATPSAGGVSWREDAGHGTVEFIPGRDLAQRLAVLPQSYLADRHITERLVLATTKQRAKAVLSAAINDPQSKSNWPEAHFLGPLHPVLEWASDRALGRLGRNEIFAVVGDVEMPTVLLVGTLTNRRGQVVATSFLTAAAPDLARPDQLFMTPHASAREALEAAGVLGVLINSGGGVDSATLQALIRPAVEQARQQMTTLAEAASRDVDERVETWSDRVSQWQFEADALVQRGDLKSRRTTVEEERKIAESMKPNQTLVRPLLVVVPRPGVS
jgi:superfamily II DNA or RNA helicase